MHTTCTLDNNLDITTSNTNAKAARAAPYTRSSYEFATRRSLDLMSAWDPNEPRTCARQPLRFPSPCAHSSPGIGPRPSVPRLGRTVPACPERDIGPPLTTSKSHEQ